MIYRLTIELLDRNFQFCDIFTDEDALCKKADEILSEQNANNGCSFGTIEDEAGANSEIAEIFNDPMNMDNFIRIEEISELAEKLLRIAFNPADLNSETVLELCKTFNIDLTEWVA